MFIPIFLIGRSDCQLDRQQRESSRAVGNRIRAFPASAMAPAMAIVSASSVTTRTITPARVVAGGRRPAAARVPAAASSASSRNDSIARRMRGRVDSGRGVAAAAFNFKNPFGGKSEPEDDADEAGDGAAYVDDAVDGNPFLSKSNRPTPSSDEPDDAAPELKLPKLPANPFASFGAKAAEPEDEEDAYEEEEEAFEEPAKSGSPFGNPFASFGAMNQTIDQTVDLDYGDDEDDFEEPKKGGFGGFALPSFPTPAKKEAKPPTPAPAAAPAKRESGKSLGNWERTFKDGVKDGDIPTWTLDPEPVRGAALRPVKLRTGDILVVGRDKGPGIDYVAKVNCVSGVHCQFEMEGNKLFVTDLGSTNGTYVAGREVRKNARTRVYNGDTVRLGAENVNGEAFVTFDTDLTGAKELDKNTEYGQVQAVVEALGGPKVVVNFLIINVFFQLGFYLLLNLQTN